MASEKFCLKWNDFDRNISCAFKELLDSKDFFDVTLACDENQIQAHKVILSACSPFFRNILRRNPHQHPVLYLKGVKYADLQSVLSFMYHGEVNVAQEELNSFLAVAEYLRVKGLTQNQSEINTKSESISPRPHARQMTKVHAPQIKKSSPRPATPTISYPVHSVDSDIHEDVPVKSEPRDPPTREPVTHQTPYQPHMLTANQSNQVLATPEDQTMVYQEEGYEDYSHYEGGLMDQELVTEGNKGERR